jgi:hypothetical protein
VVAPSINRKKAGVFPRLGRERLLDGSTHWSTRKVGRVLKIHHTSSRKRGNAVAKAWQRAGLEPHRFERYMQSDDPDLEPKGPT